VASAVLAIAVKTTAKIKFLTRDAIPLPAPRSFDDPSVAGMTVEMFAAGAPVTTLTIPPGVGSPGWRAQSGGPATYRYDNRLTPYGPSPVRTLVLTSGPLLKMLSKSLLSTTLATGTHPSIGIRLTSGSHRVCALFRGDAVRVNKPGHFTAKGTTLPPGDCTASALTQ
jgi:hypothetical protein